MGHIKKMMFTFLLVLIVNLVLGNSVNAQTGPEIKKADKLFGGAWVNKRTTRHLRIFIEKDGYVTINDWTSKKQKQEEGDAYKAYIKKGKLIMPEDLEHHTPYSEMQVKDNTLIYITIFKDNEGKQITDKEFFVKEL